MATNTTPTLILQRLAAGLQANLGLTDDQCYPAAQAAFIEGAVIDHTVQIWFGSASQDGDGEGGQLGGILNRRGHVTFTVWWRVNLDMHGHAEQALTEAGVGLLDFMESIRLLLQLTNLQNLLTECMRWESDGPPIWHEQDGGILRRDQTWTVIWAERLPNQVTL
jgi:hypothetical protein